MTKRGDGYNESCLQKVQGDKTNYKPANGIPQLLMQEQGKTANTHYHFHLSVPNALTDYDIFVVQQIMTKKITTSVLNSAFGQGSKYLHAYCKQVGTCSADSVLAVLTKVAKRIILFQG